VLDTLTRKYQKIVKGYDYCLYAERVGSGAIHIYRKHPSALGPTQFVFAVTDNWQANGRSVEWGEVPLIYKLKAIDAMTNPEFFEDLVASYRKKEAAEERMMKNSFEAMASEMYPAFKKTFANTNTTGMAKQTRRMKMEN
jgi:hypothetical protein